MSGLLRGGATGVALIVVLLVLPLVLLRGGVSRDEAREQALILSNLVNGLAAAGAVKARVSEHFAEQGRLPGAEGARDLPAEERAGWRSLGLAVGPGGVITVYVAGADGTLAGRVRLTPARAAGAGDLTWRCETGDFRHISRHVPQCAYREAER